MQIDNSILSISAAIIFLLYIYFFLNPVKLLELICFSNNYYITFVVASVALMLIMHSGFILIIGLLLVVGMMLVIISRLPAMRRVEHFYDTESGICVDRILDCYHWPSKHTGTVYRSGKSGGIFPWVEVINHHQFIYKHIKYYSLKSFCKANPDLAGAAERALLRSM